MLGHSLTHLSLNDFLRELLGAKFQSPKKKIRTPPSLQTPSPLYMAPPPPLPLLSINKDWPPQPALDSPSLSPARRGEKRKHPNHPRRFSELGFRDLVDASLSATLQIGNQRINAYFGQRFMGETKWEKGVETASCDFSAVFCSFLRLQATYLADEGPNL